MTRTCPQCGKENKSAGSELQSIGNGQTKIIPSFCWNCGSD